MTKGGSAQYTECSVCITFTCEINFTYTTLQLLEYIITDYNRI